MPPCPTSRSTKTGSRVSLVVADVDRARSFYRDVFEGRVSQVAMPVTPHRGCSILILAPPLSISSLRTVPEKGYQLLSPNPPHHPHGRTRANCSDAPSRHRSP